jgi:primosomal protein N'
MYIIQAIPLKTLPPQVPQVLSYFWDRSLPAGAVIEGPMGRRTVPAVVLAANPLEQEKIALKNADYQLKRVSSVISETPVVSKAQLALTAWLAETTYNLFASGRLPENRPAALFRSKQIPHRRRGLAGAA